MPNPETEDSIARFTRNGVSAPSSSNTAQLSAVMPETARSRKQSVSV
jgi:hypothetical protein